MNTLQISDTALITLAKNAITDLRSDAEWIRLFSQDHTRCTSPAARESIVRICRRHAQDYRPLLKCAVQKYGAQLFRRHNSKPEAAR